MNAILVNVVLLKHIKMVEYDRIDIVEGIDVNKTNLSKECDICHYWYFKNIVFKYEPYPCNGCHDLMQQAMSFNNVAIVYVKGNAYRITFWYMSKDDAFNPLLTNVPILGTFSYLAKIVLAHLF